MTNNIMIFNNEAFGEIRTLIVEEELYFIGKDIAKILGYADVNRAVKQHVDKEDLKVCNRKGYGDLYPTLWNNENDFANKVLINESGVYSLIFGSKLPEAKQFKRWVTSEVLPAIRKSECYISENAATESIDYQKEFGIRRIRKTFNESEDIRKTYEEYKELSKAEAKAKRIDNKDRIKATKIIIDTLELKMADNALNMRGSELLAIQELLTDIHKDLVKLNNKRNGGLLTAKAKEIKKLNNKIEELENDEKEYYFIDKHPFSNNYMYQYNKEINKTVKTPAYARWIQNLHLEEYLPEEYPNVDFTEPIKISLLYGHLEKFDTMNFDKAILDQISKFYDFNDSLIYDCRQAVNEYVNEYRDGYIYINIENIIY